MAHPPEGGAAVGAGYPDPHSQPEYARAGVSHLNAPSLKSASADAAVKIAAKLVAKQPKPVAAAMQKVVQADVGGAVGNRASSFCEQSKGISK